MKFINAIAYVFFGLFIIGSLGCQNFSSLPKTTEAENTADNKISDGATSKVVNTSAIRVVNPYLLERRPAPNDAKKRFNLAKQAMHDKNWVQAQYELEWLIKNYPNLSGPHLNIALLYRQVGKFDKADSAFQKAITVNNKNVNAYNQYAIFLREQGKFEQAKRLYLQALDTWPDHPDSHRNLGILYDLYLGQWEKALPYYKRYQLLLDKPDRKIAGWIADTERRVKKTQQTP